MEIRIKLYESEKAVPAKTGMYFTIDRPNDGKPYKGIAEIDWSAEKQGWNIVKSESESRECEMFPKYWGEIEVIEE